MNKYAICATNKITKSIEKYEEKMNFQKQEKQFLTSEEQEKEKNVILWA